MTPRRQLEELLCDLFGSPEELRRFLASRDETAPLVGELPAGNASLVELAHRAVEALDNRGLVGPLFWRSLEAARPRKANKIRTVAHSFGEEVPPPPDSGDQPPTPDNTTQTPEPLPLAVLRLAVREVPVSRYALAVAGFGAAASLVGAFFQGQGRVAFVATLAVLLLAVVVYLFAWLIGRGHRDPAIRPLALSFAWSALLFVDAAALLLMSSVFFARPLDLRSMLQESPVLENKATEPTPPTPEAPVESKEAPTAPAPSKTPTAPREITAPPPAAPEPATPAPPIFTFTTRDASKLLFKAAEPLPAAGSRLVRQHDFSSPARTCKVLGPADSQGLFACEPDLPVEPEPGETWTTTP